MSLPKIALPTFFVDLISTKEKHKFRPYTAKDQEILLIALEGDNKLEIVTACENLINNCVDGVEANKLPIYDFECLFLKLRIASSGESISLSIPHADIDEECDHKQLIELNLNDIKVRENPNHKKTIQLTDGIGVTMRYPTISDSIFSNPKDLLISCIESIYDKENIYHSKDSTKEELAEWVGSLENKHIAKIKEFFDTMPSVYFEIEYTCDKCKKTENRIIEGFENFFTSV